MLAAVKSKTPFYAAAGVAVLTAIIVAAVLRNSSRAGAAAGEEAAQAAVKFLNLMASPTADDLDAAWAMTSTELKSFMGKETIRKTLPLQLLAPPPQFLRREPHDEAGLRGFRCYFEAAGNPKICLTLSHTAREWQVEKIEVAMPESSRGR